MILKCPDNLKMCHDDAVLGEKKKLEKKKCQDCINYCTNLQLIFIEVYDIGQIYSAHL